MRKSNLSRNILFTTVVALVFIASFFIVKAFNKPPQQALDFAYAAADGSVSGLFDEAKKSGAVLIFFDPEVEGSNDVFSRVVTNAGDATVIAISVSSLDKQKQLELLPENVRGLKNLCFNGADVVKKYNIGNAPVTYFVNTEFYVTDAFVGNIKDSTIQKCVEKFKK